MKTSLFEKLHTITKENLRFLCTFLLSAILFLLPRTSVSQAISGLLIDNNGNPVSKADICIYNSDYLCNPDEKIKCEFPSDAFNCTRSSSSGKYHFNQLPTGNFTVIGRKGNFWFFRYIFANDSVYHSKYVDTLKKPGSLYFPVHLEKHNDQQSICVYLPGTPFWAKASDKGLIRLSNLPAGTYQALIKTKIHGYDALRCSLLIQPAIADTFSDTLSLSLNSSDSAQAAISINNQPATKPSSSTLPPKKNISTANSSIISLNKSVDHNFKVHLITDSTNVSPLQKIHLSAKANPSTTKINSWEWSINSKPFKFTTSADTFIIAPTNTVKFTCILRGTSSENQSASDTLTFIIQQPTLQVYAQETTYAGLFEKITLSAQTNSTKPVLSLSWDIGNTGKFVPTTNGSVSIGPFRIPQKKIECIVRAIDESGFSAYDTVFLKADYRWEKLLPIPELSERKSHILIPFNNSIWMIGGSRNDLWYSRDGINWNLGIATTPFGPRYGHASIVYDEKLWLIGGKIGPDSLPGDIWNTSDGINWRKITQHPFLKRYYHSATVFQNRIYIIGGMNDSADNPCLNDVWLSENGIQWTKQNITFSFSPRYGHGAVIFNNAFFLIGGHYDDFNGSKTVNDIWESKNGINWQKVNDKLSFPENHFLSYLIYDQRIWAIGGYLKNTPSTFSNLWVSNDGINWNRESERKQVSEGFHVTGTVFNNQIIMSPSASKYLFLLK